MKKITRRTILRASGLAAASLALSGCAPTEYEIGRASCRERV